MEQEVDLVAVGDVPPGLSEIRGSLPADCPVVEEKDGLAYRSDLTGVCFEIHPTGEGARFVLPLVRPSFFADEIAPLVARVAKRLDLRVARGEGIREEADEAGIAAAWRAANRKASEKEWRSQLGSLPWLPEERLSAWWEWQRELPARQRREVLFSPQVDILLDRRDGSVKTSATWPDLGAQLLPEVDLLLVTWVQSFEKRKRSGLFRRGGRVAITEKEVGGYLPFEHVRGFLGKHATRIEGPLPHHRYEGKGTPAASIDLNEVLRPEAFQPLSISELVDVRPSSLSE